MVDMVLSPCRWNRQTVSAHTAFRPLRALFVSETTNMAFHSGGLLFGEFAMTNPELLFFLKEHMQWYWCLADKNAEPGPSILSQINQNLAMLYDELMELDEFFK